CASCPSFFQSTTASQLYTLSLHDALPISQVEHIVVGRAAVAVDGLLVIGDHQLALVTAEAVAPQVQRRVAPGQGELILPHRRPRSEEHTSELQSRENLVCRLLLEKKKQQK